MPTVKKTAPKKVAPKKTAPKTQKKGDLYEVASEAIASKKIKAFISEMEKLAAKHGVFYLATVVVPTTTQQVGVTTSQRKGAEVSTKVALLGGASRVVEQHPMLAMIGRMTQE